ncbi:MAG: hypothetical protein IJ621_03455 [Paludibacteraceae bacterium]|nr:hypothetical protein [Paludibacteraceae bacterium]
MSKFNLDVTEERAAFDKRRKQSGRKGISGIGIIYRRNGQRFGEADAGIQFPRY